MFDLQGVHVERSPIGFVTRAAVARVAEGWNGVVGYGRDFVEEIAEQGLESGQAGAVDDDIDLVGVPDEELCCSP